MENLLKSINGWVPPSPVKCTPTRVQQVQSETDSVGNLKIKKLLTVKMKFEMEWRFITKSDVQRIMKEMSGFNALVIYEDLITGKEKSGYFYPGDFQPVPSVVYKDKELFYDSFPLTIIEK